MKSKAVDAAVRRVSELFAYNGYPKGRGIALREAITIAVATKTKRLQAELAEARAENERLKKHNAEQRELYRATRDTLKRERSRNREILDQQTSELMRLRKIAITNIQMDSRCGPVPEDYTWEQAEEMLKQQFGKGE